MKSVLQGKWIRLIGYVIGVISIGLFMQVNAPSYGQTVPVSPTPTLAPVLPLGGGSGCPGSLPPGSPEPCLNGFVWMDGQNPIGAKVEITGPAGQRATVFTTVSETEVDKRPHCNFDLSAFGVKPSDTITLTASYSGQSQTITHEVLSGTQQVDIVLPHDPNLNQMFATQILGQTATTLEGNFNAVVTKVASDSVGNIYVIGGPSAFILVFDAQGKFLRQWGSFGILPGTFGSLGDIAIDSEDNIYVLDISNSQVHKFTNGGRFTKSWGSHGGESGQFDIVRDIAIDHNDYIYISDDVVDSEPQRSRVQKFNNNGVFQSAWNIKDASNQLISNVGGLAVDHNSYVYMVSFSTGIIKFTNSGEWSSPITTTESLLDLTVGSAGYVYALGSSNRIVKFDPAGNPLPGWGGPGNKHGQLNNPTGITVSKDNFIYVADRGNNRIQKFDSTGNFNGIWDNFAYGPRDFVSPYSVAVDADDNIYIVARSPMSVGHTLILKFDPAGKFLTSWGDQQGKGDGQFNFASGIAVDQNSVYVIDMLNDRIQKFDKNGVFQTKWGDKGSGDRQFNFESIYVTRGIAVDSQGNVYVADSGNNRIQKFDSEGNLLTKWGRVDNLAGNQNGEFSTPRGIAVDSHDNVYVLDSGNYRVQKFDSSGQFLLKWGSLGNGNGQFHRYHNFLSGIAVDRNDNVYVADRWHRVQKFDSNGIHQASWGDQGSGGGQFSFPYSLAVNSKGELYVVDRQNARIQKFRPMTYTLPVATITDISLNARNLGITETLEMRGQGQVSDATKTITGTRWWSSKNGIIGKEPILRIKGNELLAETHVITFSVQDSQGEWSRPVWTQIYVRPQPRFTPIPTPTTTVTPIPGATPTSTSGGTPEPITPTPTPTTTPLDPNVPTQWAFLLYFVCDYKNEQAMIDQCDRVIEALKHTSINPTVRVAVLLDGAKDPDKDGRNTVGWIFRPGESPEGPCTFAEIAQAEDLCKQSGRFELAMSEENTLAQFVRLAQKKLPANHYYVAIIDHGQGVEGIAFESEAGRKFLTMEGIARAFKGDDIAPIDVLHLDACSMGLLEVAYALRENARYLIASQYLAWSYFPYEKYQEAIQSGTNPLQLAKEIILPIYAAKAGQDDLPYTLSVLDLQAVESVNYGLFKLVEALLDWLRISVNTDQLPIKLTYLEQIRAKSQGLEFDNNYMITNVDAYIDLFDWVANVRDGIAGLTIIDPASYQRVQTAADNLLKRQEPLVVAHAASGTTQLPLKYLPQEVRERYTEPPSSIPVGISAEGLAIGVTRTHGISIFYPCTAYFDTCTPDRTNTVSVANGQSNGTPVIEAYEKYIGNMVFTFTLATQWDEFLQTIIKPPEPGEERKELEPLAPLTRRYQIFLPEIRQ